MNYWLFAAGVLIVCFVLVNVFISTLTPQRARFITQHLLKWIWKLFFWLAKGKGSSKILNFAGLVTLAAFLLVWIAIFWVGNALIFISQPHSIVVSSTGLPASPLEKVYFVGYVLSTMGLGDFKPSGAGWMIYTSVISFSGFIIISTVVSYLISVFSAEIEKRKVSGFIHSIGTTPESMLLMGWDGKDFTRLSKHFADLTKFVLELTQRHTAYPILHNFHSNVVSKSFSINLAVLDEALTILLVYKPEDILPAAQDVYPLRYAITEYLVTLKDAFIQPSKHTPECLRITQLQQHHIPLKDNSEAIQQSLAQLQYRRKVLLGLIENDGWHWDVIHQHKNEHPKYDLPGMP